MPDGHEWNKNLERQFYFDNVASVGVARAIELSRINARTYRAEKAGIASSWTVAVSPEGDDMILEDGSSLREIVTVNPFTGPRAHLVGNDVRETAKLEGPTIRKATELAAQGAPLIVFPEHHLTDSGFVVGYFTVWRRDNENPKVYHGERISLKESVKIENAREAFKQYTKDRPDFSYHVDSSEDRAFVFSTKDQSQQSIDKAVEIVQLLPMQKIAQHSYETFARIADDTKETLIGLGAYVKDKIQKHIKEDGIEQKSTFDATEELMQLLINSDAEGALDLLTQIPVELQKYPLNQKILTEIWKKIAEETLHISSEQSEVLLEEIIETHEMMQGAKKVIVLVSDLGEDFAGIGLYALNAMTLTNKDMFGGEESFSAPVPEAGIQTQELSQTYEKTESAKMIIVIAAETGVGIGASVGVIEQVANIDLPQEIVEILNGTIEEIPLLSDDEKTIVFSLFSMKHIEDIQLPESVDRHVVQETVEFVQKIDQLELPQQVAAIEEETTRVEEAIVMVWESLVADKPAAEIHSPHELIDVDGDTKDFSFAFTVWILFKFMAYRRALESLKEFVTHTNDSEISLVERINKHHPEGLIQKEPTPWLLFAIIWKLAMIREQGKTTNQTVPQKKKKKTYPIVIYTYAS